MQVVICGAYRAPREMNFWIGLILMKIVLALSLTGYLLPWDQKGYWATNVATNLMTLVPLGESMQKLAVGGSSYGHHTLTRFFALHAGVLPGALIFFLVVHVALFRRHGIKTPEKTERPDQYFWPDQVLKDAVACLAVFAVVLLFSMHWNVWGVVRGTATTAELGAELYAPAEPSESYDAARPEWYFLFLFQMLKPEYFKNEFIGAIVVPGVIFGFLFLMPIVGRWKLGHAFNVLFTCALLVGAGILTFQALQADWENDSYQQAKAQAKTEAHRIQEVVAMRGGIPPEGAIALYRSDPEIQGPRLFKTKCASCHAYSPDFDAEVAEDSEITAPNLYGFASREWIARLLDSEHINGPHYFGRTAHVDGEMIEYVNENLKDLDDAGKTALSNLVAALSAEAGLKSQTEQDAADGTAIAAGREALIGQFACIDCHKFHDDGDLGSYPDLTGYGSAKWLTEFIANPEHERFYAEGNDKMPAFAPDSDDTSLNQLQPDQLKIIVRWLRGDDREEQGTPVPTDH